MGDCETLVPLMEEEENLIAAAQNIVKALGSNRTLTDDARKILADLGTQLSSITRVSETQDEDSGDQTEEQFIELEEQLNLVQTKVMNWEVGQSMIWDCGQEEAYEYLRYVDQARKLIERLEGLNVDKGSREDELLRKAHDLLQTAMNRLEEEFTHLLVQNRQPFEPEHMSFRSSEDDTLDDGSIVSFGDDSVEDVVQRDSMSRSFEEYIIELVHPDVIPDLRCIANLMFDSNYGRECSQAFINVRKDALDDCLFILEVEKLSIEDVLKMEWNSLNSKIRRWIRAMKIFVRIYLASEKWISDQIFSELEGVSSVCFAEASKASIVQLLNFGEAIAIGPHQPEKLIRILDMYELLADLIPDIDAMYSDEAGLCVRTECQDILRSLGDCAKATFLEFENAVASSISANPFPGGGIHHLTRYVMNYMKTLIDYSKTLDELLKGYEKEDSAAILPHMTPDREEDNTDRRCNISPLAQHFRSFTSILECNLEDKSKLYKDDSLGHLFLMNNIHYMAEKVKNSNLRTILGDDWIRKHNWKFQHHAMSYERATWSSILSLLRDEGLQNPGSNSISRTLLKERLLSFYLAFEDVYKSQTGWSIPDSQLREDLRISTSLKVIQAYRTFVGRHTNHISDKHIKYTADDLENFLLDLFEGSPRSLHGSHRK
ncbi:exocyst complex component EXO70E2-like [Nicotiana sylvestris]|uniref:Exocyst subunit Exo70 family protein n=2 Tax=Nicotiana TaxID=4085 RepID=A0A1S6GXA8_TOBAC|nr:PREDICTED: exocyst complex component EXO70B1-like [Nicotiana sylvestris]AQS27896.1 exocyst complex subunit EXO70 isoform E1a [Nicotiana tabacum]